MDQNLLTAFDQNLLTIFVVLATIAVLIQTGIAAGLLIATLKITQQANRAMAESRRLLEPTHRLVDSLETASLKFSEFTASSQGTLSGTANRFEESLRQFRRKVA
jgi:hypothetical protein